MSTFLHSTTFLFIILLINLMLLLLYIISNIKLSKLRKNYSDFMSKLGKGNNIDEMLQKYIDEVVKVNLDNKELEKHCNEIDERNELNLSKIGLIRYNAFKDTGSNLSFALTILNTKNDGIVLNGIYSRDSSNIYCKTIKSGKSEYALSKEEEESIKKAIENNNK